MKRGRRQLERLVGHAEAFFVGRCVSYFIVYFIVNVQGGTCLGGTVIQTRIDTDLEMHGWTRMK